MIKDEGFNTIRLYEVRGHYGVTCYDICFNNLGIIRVGFTPETTLEHYKGSGWLALAKWFLSMSERL